MGILILFYFILIPAAIATGVHNRLNHTRKEDKLFLFLCYCMGLFMVSLLAKSLQGWSSLNIIEAFSNVNSFVKYGIVELFAAILLPLGFSIVKAKLKVNAQEDSEK